VQAAKRVVSPGDDAALHVRVDSKRFPAVGEAPARQVLGQLGFVLRRREVVALTGPSGCGKTTLLNLVAGLDADFDGRIQYPSAGRLAYVFQEPRLLPWRSVEQNLALVLPRGEASRQRIAHTLAEVGLGDAATTFASRLSLGMARRAALARAFVIEPDLLLLDEPFASLDRATAQRLRLLLLDLLEARRAAALFVTHDLEEAVMLGHRLLVLTASPARLAAEIPIPLSAAARRDETAVADMAGELRRAVRAEVVP
jgi:ABC-type nitrate/sulfonate/bicarbonate transport system ATPase subunit